jgi:hypothetical protein
VVVEEREMNDLEQVEQALRERFGTTDGIFAWILEYGATHSVARLVLHRGSVRRGVEVQCTLCYFFCGDFTGGPYRLRFETQRPPPDPLYEIADEDGAFILRFGMVSVQHVGHD